MRKCFLIGLGVLVTGCVGPVGPPGDAGEPGISGYYVHDRTDCCSGASGGETPVDCPGDGDKALDGNIAAVAADGGIIRASLPVYLSEPSDDGHSWVFIYGKPEGWTEPWGQRFRLICAKVAE